MDYWQMTFDEMMSDSFRPKMSSLHEGFWGFKCPICGDCVGFKSIRYGFMHKKDQCKNGHKVDWSEVNDG